MIFIVSDRCRERSLSRRDTTLQNTRVKLELNTAKSMKIDCIATHKNGPCISMHML